jgi:lipopolysaccharide export system protein LptA
VGDKSRATADRGVFDERTGLMELRGNAEWQAGDRMARAEVLQYDRTNKVFTAHTNAYLKVATADLGNRAGSNLPAMKAGSWALPDFIEVFAKDYTYSTNLLVFRGDVRGKFLDGKVARGTIECGFLGLQFSNQLQAALATEKVTLEQFPFATSSGKVARRMQCEQLQIKMSPNGSVERIVALTNVLSHQDQWRTNLNVPVRSRFGAEFVTADFFPRTNQIRKAVADRDVWLSQEQPRGPGDPTIITNYLVRGDRAVFTGTNNIAELTGHPTAYTPRGSITNAEVLIWDRTKNVFMGRQVQGRGEVQGAPTNAPRPPELPFTKNRRRGL